MRCFFALLLLVNGCSSPHVTDELGLTQVTFPNGTLINDARVSGQAPLHQGDVLALGGVRLTVALRAAAAAEAR